jgi:hypothetical protein
MCQHRTSKKKQRHVLICMMSLVGCIRHLTKTQSSKASTS